MVAVHITTIDFGGAYRAAKNISTAMQNSGIESYVILREKRTDEDSIAVYKRGLGLLLSRIKNLINLIMSRGEIINDMLGTDLSHNKYVKKADVVFIHWANSFLSYGGLASICSLGKPVYVVMHDEWYFTGGCHLDYGCNRYENECGKCPILGSSDKHDLSNRIITIKKKMWENAGFGLIAPSNYMASKAFRSSLMGGRSITVIHNPIDTELYCPDPQPEYSSVCRIGFGALKPGETWKGADLLWNSLVYLDKDAYVAIVAGNLDKKETDSIPIKCELRGMLGCREMVEFYNSVDVCAIPSRQENLSNFVLEAMSCGKPVVAYDIGGMRDMITHKMTGYLAEPFNTEDFARGIEYCARNRVEMGRTARSMIKEKFSLEVIGKQYLKLCYDTV